MIARVSTDSFLFAKVSFARARCSRGVSFSLTFAHPVPPARRGPSRLSDPNSSSRSVLLFLSSVPLPLFFPQRLAFSQKPATEAKHQPCATVAVRAWFGPAPHIRGAHTHAVPAVVRLTSYHRREMSALPLGPGKKRNRSKVLNETSSSS